MAIYNNIPSEKPASSSDQTVEIFNNYYTAPVNINNNELIALVGLLENKGFDPLSAETTAITILTQAAKDGFKAMEIMDTITGIDNAEITKLVAEIINLNRLKTSQLGIAKTFSVSETVTRNVLA
jgi:hypothetical protein